MLFRKKKKNFTQINTFQDQSSGWDSSLVKPHRRAGSGETFDITYDMMKKGSIHTRGSKKVRQFGVMVGTDLKLVTSGDKVDRETYEALLAVDAIEAPNHQLNIPGIQGDRPAPPPKPVVVEAIEHVNPVHHEVVGLASVRPMRRKVDHDENAPKDRRDNSPEAKASDQIPGTPSPESTAQKHVAAKAAEPKNTATASAAEMPAEEKLEALDRHIAPVTMPPDDVVADADDDALPPSDLPGGIDQEADAFDLPPSDLPEGVDMETDENEPAPATQLARLVPPTPEQEVSPAEVEAEADPEQHDPGHVQTEMMELLGNTASAKDEPAKGKPSRKQPAKKKRGKRRR